MFLDYCLNLKKIDDLKIDYISSDREDFTKFLIGLQN